MYNFLGLHSAQILVFCRCVHTEYNNNSALKIPYRPCSGCAMLCLLGKKLTLRKGIESQLFTEFGSSSRFFSTLMVLCQSLQWVGLTKYHYKATDTDIHKLLVSHAVATENHLFGVKCDHVHGYFAYAIKMYCEILLHVHRG